MIRVYVREADEERGALLGEFEPEHLPRLIEKFEEYQTYSLSEGRFCTFSAAQFVSEEGRAVFFEIVLEAAA